MGQVFLKTAPTVWLTGTGAPDDATGSQGDLYLRTSNGDVHRKNGTAWGSAIMNLKGDTGVAPTGAIMPWGALSVPTGWLSCDGSAVSRTTYSALFGAIGTSFGAGNGSSTFNLPDVRGRVPIGKGQGSGLTNRSLAASGGSERVALDPSELAPHTHDLADHTHGLSDHQHGIGDIVGAGSVGGGSDAIGPSGDSFGVTDPGGAGQTGAAVGNTSSTGGGASHENMMPYLVTAYIIKA